MMKLILYYTVVLIALFLAILQFFLADYDFDDVGVDEFLANPEAYSGQEREFAGFVLSASEDSFVVRVNRRDIEVHYDGPVPRGQVEFHSVLNADGTVTAINVHNLSYNYLKYILSFLK